MAEDAFYLSAADVAKLRLMREAFDSSAGASSPILRGGGPRYAVYRLCKGLLTSSITSTDATLTVDHVTPLVGTSPTTSDTATLTVANPYQWSGVRGAVCKFYLPCPSTSTDWELEEVATTSNTEIQEIGVCGLKVNRLGQIVQYSNNGVNWLKVEDLPWST